MYLYLYIILHTDMAQEIEIMFNGRQECTYYIITMVVEQLATQGNMASAAKIVA